MAVNPIPAGYHTVTPMFILPNAGAFMDFVLKAFDSKDKERHLMPDGSLMHGEMFIGDSIIMVGSASEKYPAVPLVSYLYVPDVDAVYAKAMAASPECKSLREPTTEFYGDRSCGLIDPWGNQWWIATHVEDVSPEELERRAAEAMKG